MKDTRKSGGPRKPGGAAGKPARGDKPFRKDGPRKDGPRTDGPRKAFSSKPKGAPKPNPDHLAVTGEGERISKVMSRRRTITAIPNC